MIVTEGVMNDVANNSTNTFCHSTCNQHIRHGGFAENEEKEIQMTDLISRADAIDCCECHGSQECKDRIKALPSADAVRIPIKLEKRYPESKDEDITDAFMRGYLAGRSSADAVHGWRIGKPTEQGKYMVTLDSFGHKHIDLFYYGKPLMPNRKVRGKCWYRSDDEWGDVVYDDTDILAWQPLPTPYKGGDTE